MCKIINHNNSYKLTPVCAAMLLAFNLQYAEANPVGGSVVNGQAIFNNTGNTLTVTNTPGTIINWQGFSINANEVTRFAQQSAASTVLNRVVTNNPSVILGTLSSNGQVYLVNANGIMFGAGSTVDVAGLVATSLNLSDADFLAGRHNYTAVPGAQNISNAGNINVQQGGQIYLIAPNVENTGIVTAPNGEILLVAGNSVELVNSLDPNLRVSITAPAGNATNLGQLIAQAGSLGLFGTVVKNSGTVSADSAVSQGGKIVFKASQLAQVGGTVSATGTTGGTIEVLGNDVQVTAGAVLDASGTNGGGTVLVGGDAHGANSNVQNAQTTYVDATATIKADATQNGNGGKVVVWSDNATQFSGNISARGGALSGNGGWVEVSGKQWLDYAGLVDTRAPNGLTGSLLLDPTDITISTAAQTTTMTNTSGVFADAATSPSNLNITTLVTQLALSNVTVDTTSGLTAGLGNITVQNAIAWNSAFSLTLNATGIGAIVTNTGATIINTGTGGLTMQTAGGSITLNAGVTLAGGTFSANAVGVNSTIAINAPVSTGTGAINLTAGSTITTSTAVTASNTVSMTGVGITNNSTITGNLGVSLNAGTGTLTNIAGATITNGGGTSTGVINLTADNIVLASLAAGNGTVTAGAGAVNISNSTLTNTINLGGAITAGTLALSSADLATISTTGLMSIGNASNSGNISVLAPMTFTNNTALVNSAGGISIGGVITATGKNLTLNTTGLVQQLAGPGTGITTTGLELLGTGSYTLNDPGNSIATLAGNAGSVILTNSTALSLGTVNTTVGLTSTGAVTLVTPGNITLNAGGIINAGTAVILASTAGNFINNSGSATPITATSAQIWAASPASNVKGGMIPAASSFACNYSLGTCGATIPAFVNGYNFLYTLATAPVLTIVADSLSKYFSLADPALTYTASGLVGGDTAANVLSGTLVRAPGQSLGTYAINQGTLTAAAVYGYAVTFVPGTFTIMPAPPITPPILSELVKTTLFAFDEGGRKKKDIVLAAGEAPMLVCQ